MLAPKPLEFKISIRLVRNETVVKRLLPCIERGIDFPDFITLTSDVTESGYGSKNSDIDLEDIGTTKNDQTETETTIVQKHTKHPTVRGLLFRNFNVDSAGKKTIFTLAAGMAVVSAPIVAFNT